MKLIIELSGTQTDTHCSGASSVNHCEKLNMQKDKCKLFKTRLEYDFSQHAYKKCKECLENTIDRNMF